VRVKRPVKPRYVRKQSVIECGRNFYPPERNETEIRGRDRPFPVIFYFRNFQHVLRFAKVLAELYPFICYELGQVKLSDWINER
jgi:hypothetical protein